MYMNDYYVNVQFLGTTEHPNNVMNNMCNIHTEAHNYAQWCTNNSTVSWVPHDAWMNVFTLFAHDPLLSSGYPIKTHCSQ